MCHLLSRTLLKPLNEALHYHGSVISCINLVMQKICGEIEAVSMSPLLTLMFKCIQFKLIEL